MQIAPLRHQLGYFFAKRVKFYAIFSCFSKTDGNNWANATSSSELLGLLCRYPAHWIHFTEYRRRLASLVNGFEPVRNGEIFWMNNNTRFLDSLWRRANLGNISFIFFTVLNWSFSNQLSWQNQIFIIDWSQFNKNVRIEWFHFG